MARLLTQFIRKYRVVIFFPTFTAATIFADFNHTRQWKRKVLEAKRPVEELLA